MASKILIIASIVVGVVVASIAAALMIPLERLQRRQQVRSLPPLRAWSK